MNKRKRINLKATFFLISWIFSTNYLREWGLGMFLSLILGFIFIVALWIGVEWTIKSTFGK
jgi:hypothetical protein